ncbi:MAG: hypothetical protein IH939_09135 [Acidobacteria bacterium]|nr:hypothetical protein [Acidobacteriota bacterium]
MNLQPKNGYLIVKALEPKKMTETGIVLPEGAQEDDEQQTSFCEVLAIPDESEYKKGETVLFSKLVPDDVMVEVDGKKELWWFVKETDVKAILKKDGKH